MLIRYLLLLLLFLSFNVFSQNYNMNINLSDGSTVSYPVQEIQKITFDGITNIKDTKQIQKIINSFKLFQNYPNPFNPNTIISYQLPNSGNVEVNIFNINGQIVRKLYSGFQTSGNHQVVWNGNNGDNNKVASGLYIYQVKFDNKSFAKKMILIK